MGGFRLTGKSCPRRHRDHHRRPYFGRWARSVNNRS